MQALTFIAPMGQAVIARRDNTRGGPADHPLRKTIENRPRSLPGKMLDRSTIVAVHCGLKWNEEYADTCRRIFEVEYSLIPGAIQHGQIIGLMQLSGRQFASFADAQRGQPHPNCLWFGGPFGYEIADAVAFQDPIPCRGMQGWWPVPVKVQNEIYSEMSRVAPHWGGYTWTASFVEALAALKTA